MKAVFKPLHFLKAMTFSRLCHVFCHKVLNVKTVAITTRFICEKKCRVENKKSFFAFLLCKKPKTEIQSVGKDLTND